MATITTYTSDKMKELEDETIVAGFVSGSDLILVRHDASEITLDDVVGPQGDVGPPGEITIAQMNDAISAAHAPNSITSTMITGSSVNTAKIADAAVSTTKIADSSVTSTKFAANAITTAKIKDAAIGSDAMAPASASAGKFAVGSVTQEKLAVSTSGTIDSGRILYSRLGNIITVRSNGDFGYYYQGNAVVLPVGFRPAETVNAVAWSTYWAYAFYVTITPGGVISAPSTGSTYFSMSFRAA